ncbi:DUF2974 domain-containing protein [Pseudoxanthomonas sp. CF385]|uniref:lipase family protein n=1 Tax=Pseudoxanthomonas sp. CF385 TaxID=1881042 RepID=UPI001587828B|nr:DUF2974 domain-containing protein [Pseudoxanthomonas sp. CF385]
MGGAHYWVIEHVDNKNTGYQGTIYQRANDGAIVVAHRGTEEVWMDGVAADGSMVLSRVNPQASDAVELTRRALAIAREDGRQPGKSEPEVTVTGHSLGGTLAQVAAHHFDLRGETFNAYGAASLDRRIPEGGVRMLNHAMAGDTVSAASPHYGQVRIYATASEVATLKAAGYHNQRFVDLVTPNNPILAAGASLGSHSMHQFLPVDGDGRLDRSALEGFHARVLADDNRQSIARYRDDVLDLRRGVTAMSRGPFGLVRDGVDHLRGPLPAGEPAAHEYRELQQRSSRTSPSASADPGKAHNYTFHWEMGRGASIQTPLRTDVAMPSREVDRLLTAARTGDVSAVRAAQEDLQASEFGQSWRALVQERQRDLERQRGFGPGVSEVRATLSTEARDERESGTHAYQP